MHDQRNAAAARARELRLAGLSYREISREVGYSHTWVGYVTVGVPAPGRNGKRSEFAPVFCLDCGAALDRWKGYARCRKCQNVLRRLQHEDQARCSHCEQWKPLDAFSPSKPRADRNRTVRSWCKECEAEAHRKRFGDDPRKSNARLQVLRALRSGRLTKGPCEVCGTNEDVEGHHDDYAHPLRVRWLCVTHHLIEHRARPCGEPDKPEGYRAIHAWMEKHHPKAGVCEECGAAGRTDHAFLRHPQPHTTERADYRELCRSCHLLFDYAQRVA